MVTESERRIAVAVNALVVTEGVPIGEVAELCGLAVR